jgi:SNF2 family DNA or RNA helicase
MLGARWDPEHRIYTYRGSVLHEDLESYRPRSYSWPAHVERKLNNDDNPVVPGQFSLKPRPDQELAIKWIQEAYQKGAPGFLLADEMGLGKTLVAWEAMKTIAPKNSRVAIVTPLSVVGNWADTVMDRGIFGQDLIILNYEKMRVFFDVSDLPRNRNGSKKGKTLKGVARFGDMESVDYLIFDESHRLKTPTAARSKFAFRLYEKAKFIIWLSGTPGQNPLELAYLLPILRFRTEGNAAGPCTAEALEGWAGRQRIKIKRGSFGRWEIDEHDDERIAQIIFGPERSLRVAARRKPSDIVGWPEVQRILHPVELEEDEERQYNQTWEELRAAVLNTPVADRGKANSPAMVALMRYRQKAPLIRVPLTLDLAEDFIDNGHQVAISCEFLDTIRAFEQDCAKRKIKTAKVTGEINSPEMRQQAMDRFNKGEVPVFLFTVTEGINLRSTTIFGGVGWPCPKSMPGVTETESLPACTGRMRKARLRRMSSKESLLG